MQLGGEGGGIWAAVADRVLAKPAVFAIVTGGALLAMASPVATLNLGFNQSASGLPDAVEAKLRRTMKELRICMFCTGAQTLGDLRNVELIDHGARS